MQEKNYPNYSQLVKRIVKYVTDALYKVCGFKRRNGFICIGITCRCVISVADTKAHYSQAHLQRLLTLKSREILGLQWIYDKIASVTVILMIWFDYHVLTH